jgi:NAD(P)-dependent dehydrogenase (short-subunit alcohol dehydrogenase family)
MIDFSGQSVIVTGAGRGLGRLYALELARRGAQVVVNDIGSTTDGHGSDSTVADSVVAEITAAGGIAVASHESVDAPEGGAAIVQAALESFGRLDAVVSNAGIFQTVPFADLPVADWRRMLSVHLDGAFHLSQPAFRAMRDQSQESGPGGRFVFVASSAGLFGQAEVAHYAAAKAGLLGLTNVIAIEGAAHGILANTVLPFGYSRMVADTIGDREQIPEELAFLDAIKPELVVPLVTFLASDAHTLTHHNFSALARRYARVFVGLADGWIADPNATPTADDIALHLAPITAPAPYTIPASIYEEVATTSTHLHLF